jgi:TRAP-type C4-dicarboxylate transport system permease small subunit
VIALKRTLDAVCSALAALALFGIMWLTLFDVAGRKLASTSLPGALELTEILMVVVIFAGLPLVSLHGEHVVFDSLDRWLPRAVRRMQSVAIDALCMAALAGIAVVLWQKAGQMSAYGDTTAQLKLPLGPFVYGMSVLSGVAALVHVLLVFTPVAHHHSGTTE